MNKCTLIGRVTKDIEVRYTQAQMAVAHFTLTVNRRKKDGADFITCTAFGKTAEVMGQYVAKGHRVGIAGHIQTGSYENQDGKKVYTTDVIVDELEFLESKNTAKPDADGFASADDSEKLPF